MSLLHDLPEQPAALSVASKYTVLNGLLCLGTGALLLLWPGIVQSIFRDSEFVGHVLLAAAGAFPHTFLTLAVLEPVLGIGAWMLLSRKA